MDSPVDEKAAKATVSLPFAWRLVVVIGSVASTIVLSVVGLAFQSVREEWREMRSDIRSLRQQVASSPNRAEFDQLSNQVDDLEKRVTRVETHFWDK